MPAPTSPEAVAVFASDAFVGRRVLVTGGGSGIGRATALLFARTGAHVAITGRREEALLETAALAAELGAPHAVLTVPADVRETEQVDAMLDRVLSPDGLGGLDVLVNNAGGQFLAPAEQISPNGFRAVTRLNLDSVWYLSTRVADRAFLPQKSGVVVCVTMTPHRGVMGMSHSSAARAGVESLVRTWAQEWGGRGVRCVAIAPGIVHTDSWERYGIPPEMVAAVIPLARLQTADEVAATIAFIASPAGAYITGTTLTADGGLDVAGPGMSTSD